MDKSTAVIIPTYNEVENIGILLKKIFHTLPQCHVFIVDDSNASENKKLHHLVDEKFNNVEIISRQSKKGRGGAVLAGFREALKNKKIDYFFEMDADLAHDPGEFYKFLDMSTSSDVVIGSRYLENSHIKSWPMRRLILSKLINAFLTLWLGLKLSDYTNGYRLYTRKAVEFLIKQNLRETGFIALSEISYRLKHAGFHIAEVPISFTDRIYGKSSAGLFEHMNAFLGALRIRFS